MRPSETPLASLQRQLDAGQNEAAIGTADAIIASNRRSFAAWLGRARANLNQGWVLDADRDAEEALRLAPSDPQAVLLRAQCDQRLGRIDAAVARLRPMSAAGGGFAVEASVLLAEVLHYSHRRAELADLVAAGGAWSNDPRAALALARVQARERPEDAIEILRRIADASSGPMLHRIAGFELVQLLDRLGRFREAFDLATALHAATTLPYDLEGLLLRLDEQRALLARGSPWFTPRADPVQGVAMVVGMPRSGTTLLEQMLDRHPAICGIGEYEGIDRMGDAVVSTGRWPRGIGMMRPEAAAKVRGAYADALPRLRRPGAAWTFDKTLSAWAWLPAVACFLPGAVCLRVERDPRDTAISMFLSFFNPRWYGWMSSIASITRVIDAERSLVPQALSALGIPHESMRYEDLVADPASQARRCLSRMGLPMDDAVLAPEGNARAVYTLSHEQVRRPINAASIGRWRNYAWAFE
jgi:tetratricopeptide (TPR) repeat protein